MGLKEILRESVLIDGVVSLLGIDLWNDEYQEGNRHELREKDMPNLKLAQLFVDFNSNASYFLRGPPKSKLYSSDEIAKVLINNGYASNLEQGIVKAQELIEKEHIGFYWASRGAAGIKIVPYKRRGDCGSCCVVETPSSQDTKYRFEVEFLDDGL